MKKLTLQRETLRVLDHLDLNAILGGQGSVANTTTIIGPSRACPPPTFNGCTTGPCVETISTGTSVINPSGG